MDPVKLQGDLAQALTDGLGNGYTVRDYLGTVDAVQRPTVAVWATDLEPLAEAPNGHYRVTLTVELYTAHQDPQRAEDDLATTLAAVLAVLWPLDRYLLTRAVRTVAQDGTVHAWTLTVTGGLEITPAED